MHDDLKKLGLTENEIKVYLSLLKIGETPVGGIINEIKFHRQLVYNALDSLMERNMILKTKVNKINHYKINDPKAIVEQIETQKLIAERLSQNIGEEMKKSKHEQELSILDGPEKMRQYYLLKFKDMPENSTLLAMFATGHIYEKTIGLNNLKQTEKIRDKKNITTRHITSEALREDIVTLISKINAKTRQIRYLPYNFTNPVTTLIWHDSVAFQIFGDFPFIIDIVNKGLHETFTEHFWTLWKIAKK